MGLLRPLVAHAITVHVGLAMRPEPWQPTEARKRLEDGGNNNCPIGWSAVSPDRETLHSTTAETGTRTPKSHPYSRHGGCRDGKPRVHWWAWIARARSPVPRNKT